MRILTCCWWFLMIVPGWPAVAPAENFSAGADTAVKFGVHEIVLTGNGAVANPFDTAYFLLSPHSADGGKTSDDDVKKYVRDAANRGITSVRGFSMTGPKGYLDDGPGFAQRWWRCTSS